MNYQNAEARYYSSRERVAKAIAEGSAEALWSVLPEQLSERRSESLDHLSPEEQYEKISSRVLEIIPRDDLLRRLTESKATKSPLSIKYGIDPTGSEIHLGHAVPIVVLSRMQRMGHRVTFVVGDFTARIGDPSGRVASRPVLTAEQIYENMKTYIDQVSPILDVPSLDVQYNGEWLNRYSLGDLIGVVSRIPAAQALQREDFRQRLGSGLTLAETLYPVVMAIDSVKLNSDVELGGKDQLLNMQMCRTVMDIHGQTPEVIVSTDIMEGIDGSGKKMGKSLNNYVALQDSPDDIYGRIMSIPDTLMSQYYAMLTEIEPSEWDALADSMRENKVNPMEIKKILAYDLVTMLHGRESAELAKNNFEVKFSAKNYDNMDDLPQITADNAVESIKEILSDSRGSHVGNAEMRRLVEQGGVRFIMADGTQHKVSAIEELSMINDGVRFIKVGKRVIIRFAPMT